MQIEISEEVLKLNIDGRLVTHVKGDLVTVDDDVAAVCLANGWAFDPTGKVESVARNPGASGEIFPDKILQPAKG